jgi:ubiquinone/menaquinone biosynthesis C-methylase UbiE
MNENVLNAWKKWLDVTLDRCHLHFELEGGSVESHIAICNKSSLLGVERVAQDLPANFKPKRILEIGASVGFISLAISKYYKDAKVYSVEPDSEAVTVADAMAVDENLNYKPVVGVGEALPYEDNYFDLIICHTVIEHVQDESAVIAEMTRVLSIDGYIHLDAPNYVWPYEPHLGIWCIPVLGKNSVRFMSCLQGKRKENWYIEDLRFVTPRKLEKIFRKNNLVWTNRAKEKLIKTANGTAVIKRYKWASKMLFFFEKIWVSKATIFLLVKIGLYPSVMYTMQKHRKEIDQ